MQSLHRRLSRMRGERTNDDEKIEQEAKIKQLRFELEQKQATGSVLNEQIKRVNVCTATIPTTTTTTTITTTITRMQFFASIQRTLIHRCV